MAPGENDFDTPVLGKPPYKPEEHKTDSHISSDPPWLEFVHVIVYEHQAQPHGRVPFHNESSRTCKVTLLLYHLTFFPLRKTR